VVNLFPDGMVMKNVNKKTSGKSGDGLGYRRYRVRFYHIETRYTNNKDWVYQQTRT
jgi:hypothetical protein